MNGDGWGDFACFYNDTWDTTFALFHPRPGNYLGNYEIFKGEYGALVPRAYQSGRPALVLRYRVNPPSPFHFLIHLGGVGLDTIPDAVLAIDELFSGALPMYAGDVNDDGWGAATTVSADWGRSCSS